MKMYSVKILFIVLIMYLGKDCLAFTQCSTSRCLDSLALIQLYDATSGDQWINNSDWKTNSIDNWYGVVLTSDGQNVRQVLLSGNGLTGNLPNISLPKLEVLQLQTNQIGGSIPDLGLPMLENLQLADNDFVGVMPSLSGCPNLEVLLLGANELEGNIPNFNLNNLSHLSLYCCNNLTGLIPDFANCPNLTILDVATNQLSSVADLSNLPLCSLDLFDNELTFDGVEVNASTFPLPNCTFNYHSQDSIPIIQTGNVLSVNAGGTMSNNTFEWYQNGNVIQTISGVNTLTITQGGTYYVKITNSIANQLDLYSKSIDVLCNANTLTIETTVNNDLIVPVLNTIWMVDTLNYPVLTALPSGMTDYSWGFDGNLIGGNQQTINGAYTNTSGMYGVTVTDACGNTAGTEVYLYLDDDSVWPGDIDCNDVVNMDDLLEWGHIPIGTNGNSRSNTTIVWEGQACQDWSIVHPESGKNVKHSDCDGNGTVELLDVDPILDNFHAQHNGNNAKVGANMQGVELVPIADPTNNDITGDGEVDTVFFDIHLKNENNANFLVDDVYGIRFSIAYQPFQNGGVLDAVETDFDNSWLGEQDVSLKGLYKNFISDSIMYVGVTRITQQDTTGHGILCEVGCILQVDLLNLRTENPTTTNGNTRTPFTASDYQPFILKTEDVRLIDENAVPQAISGSQDTVWIVPNYYCKPALNSSNEWIGGVSIGSFTQISGNDNGYQVFTDTILQLGSGEILPIQLTPGFANTTQNEVWQVWLDINEDDLFTNNEILFTSTPNSNTITNNITIPNMISNGQTRLRIAMKRDTAPNSACEQFSDGEVEDYLVNIVPSTTVKLNVFLEAGYDSINNTMSTNLLNSGLLPQTQPFNTAPWQYDGTEQLNTNQTDIVDWLLLELRASTEPYQTIGQQAVLLLEDGTVVNTNHQNIQFYNLSNSENYHITLRARNHIAVMTAMPLQITNNQMVYDFTTPNTQVMGGTQQLKLVSSTIIPVYALCAGDLNSDGIINVNDYQHLNDDMGSTAQYLSTDVNLDGVVNIADFNIYAVNKSLIGAHCIRY